MIDTAQKVLETTLDGINLLLEHEAQALESHWDGLQTRLAVAKRARDASELVRDQLALLPDTQARLSVNHDLRLRLARGLWRDVQESLKAA